MVNQQLKKDYIWNTLSSIVSAGSGVIYLALVTQLLGGFEGGVFALAYAIANQFLAVGLYDTRTYQATDLKEKYPFGTYLSTRIITCILMLVGVFGYAVYADGFTYGTLIFMYVGGIKFFDAFEDVFHGYLQQHNQLNVAARARFFRVLVTIVSFALVMVFSRDLATSCLVAIILSAITMVALNFPVVKKTTSIKPIFTWSPIKSLLITCFPLFVGTFLYGYLSTAPRLAIETFLSVDDQAYFAIIFMPAMLINMGSGMIFRPLLTSMANHWQEGRVKELRGFLGKGIGFSLLLTLALVILAIPLGTPFLSLIYGLNIDPYLWPLIIMLVGGGLNATSIIAYYALVIIRRQKVVMVGYGASAIGITALSYVFVPLWGLMGAAWAYLGGMLLLNIVFLAVVFWRIK